MKYVTFFYLVLSILVLSACGGSPTVSTDSEGEMGSVAVETQPTEAVTGDDSVVTATQDGSALSTSVANAIANAVPVTELTADYQDALPVSTQLAVGMLQLEGTDQAVTEAQAAELLPLWQLLNTLQSSGTAADVEMNAVVNQIQSVMAPDQLGAIASLTLTADDMTDLISTGGFGFGRGSGNGNQNGDGGGRFTDGGPPEGMAPPGAGMGPGGGGGIGPGSGGGSGGDLGGFDPSMMATRQAELASGDNSVALDQMAVVLVTHLMQLKTGEFTGQPGGGIFNVMIAALAEAMHLEETSVREALQAGQTPNELIVEHDVDPAAVRDAILAGLDGMEFPAGQDPDKIVDSFLSGTMGQGQPSP